MAFLRAKTALSNIEDRLRRVFGLTGLTELELEQRVTLVALAADLTQPGSSIFRGRRFALVTRANTIVAAGFGWVMRLGANVRIDQILLNFANQGSGSADLWFLSPDTAPVNAANVQGGTWIDNKLTATELPPLFLSAENPINLAGEAAPTSRVLLWSSATNANSRSSPVPMQAFFPQGTHVIYRREVASATDDDSVALYGQIF